MFRINQLFRHIGRYSIIRTNVIHFPQIRSNTTPKIVPVNTNRNFYSTDSKLSENKPHTSNLAHQAHFFSGCGGACYMVVGNIHTFLYIVSCFKNQAK